MQKNGRFHDQVKAAVSVGLGLGDVVLPLEERDIVLAQKGVGQLVDIRWVRADHAHARDIVQIFFDAVHCERITAARELFHNAFGRFEPGLDRFDGVAVVLQGKLFVQYVELCFDFHHRAAVIAHQFAVGAGIFLHPLLYLASGKAGKQHLLKIRSVAECCMKRHSISSFAFALQSGAGCLVQA